MGLFALQVGAEGKRLRPTMLLLMASALSSAAPSPSLLGVDERPPNQHPGEERRCAALGMLALGRCLAWLGDGAQDTGDLSRPCLEQAWPEAGHGSLRPSWPLRAACGSL